MNTDILHLATTLGQLLRARDARVTVAESCTGGGLGAAITAVPGSSQWFDAGFIAYSNAAKQRWLNVEKALLDHLGAVSGDVAEAMAAGALEQAEADYAVAITGIAGPDGGTAEKPVGTVWLGWASRSGHRSCKVYYFKGDRESVRQQSIAHALQGMLIVVQSELDQRAVGA